MNRKCVTCGHSYIEVDPQKNMMRVCKRFPPAVIPITVMTHNGPGTQLTAVYPMVADDNTCGEYVDG